MRISLFLILLLGLGCDVHDSKAPVTTSGRWLRLVTVEHDGHKFVCGQTGCSDGGVSIVHHPDCPCGKVK